MIVRKDVTIGKLIIQSILMIRINQLHVTYIRELELYAKEVCNLVYDNSRIEISDDKKNGNH